MASVKLFRFGANNVGPDKQRHSTSAARRIEPKDHRLVCHVRSVSGRDRAYLDHLGDVMPQEVLDPHLQRQGR